jgi:hypothetical protein
LLGVFLPSRADRSAARKRSRVGRWERDRGVQSRPTVDWCAGCGRQPKVKYLTIMTRYPTGQVVGSAGDIDGRQAVKPCRCGPRRPGWGAGVHGRRSSQRPGILGDQHKAARCGANAELHRDIADRKIGGYSPRDGSILSWRGHLCPAYGGNHIPRTSRKTIERVEAAIVGGHRLKYFAG